MQYFIPQLILDKYQKVVLLNYGIFIGRNVE